MVPSIMQLAFLLLTSLEEGNDNWARSTESTDDPLGVEELGVQMLKTMFEVHGMARSEVGLILHHFQKLIFKVQSHQFHCINLCHHTLILVLLSKWPNILPPL